MASFKYVAKDTSGKTITGSVTAADQGEVLNNLRSKGLVVLKVQAQGARTPSPGRRVKRGKPKKGELELFTRQLATMISSGIALMECLEILQEQIESPGFKGVIEAVIEDIRSGTDFSTALERHPKAYSRIYVSMVRAGEASGQLDEILVRLADYLESVAALKREIKSAMTYPVVSLFLVLGIAIFLMVGIVPKFKEIFDGLGVPLPGITKKVMSASLWMKANVVQMLLAIVSLPVGISMAKKTQKGREAWDRFILNVPVFGQLFRKVALSRFSKTFATMIKSGVPIMGSLEIVGATSGNTVIEHAVDKAIDSVRQGETLAEPLATEPVFPPMVVRMVAIGEKSGALEALLGKISEFYDQQVEAEVKGLTSLIEPIMIAFMGIIVGGIVLAVFLPILKLQEALTPK